MDIILHLRKCSREKSEYDLDIYLTQWIPLPDVGERLFFYHGLPMYIVVNERTFEILNFENGPEYHITLWGSYHLNVEGQKGEEI
jgi:hypothetical protein